jgi:hypothetical protein
MSDETLRMHLGVDYGTSWSKLVLRDYDRDTARIVAPAEALQLDRGFESKFPSLVTYQKGTLWFGWEAERRRAKRGAISYGSVKVRMALPEAFRGEPVAFPEGLTATDLATLTVLFLVQVGEAAATRHASKLGREPRMSFTIGAPMSQLDQKGLQRTFVQMARLANALRQAAPPLVKGLHPRRARSLLDEAKREVEASESKDPRVWVRSEVESALIWPFRSPTVAAGLYAAIDVGAGTTDASFFRITPELGSGREGKRGLAIFGAASAPPGMDEVDAVLADPGEDPLAVRMSENERLGARPALLSRCEPVFERIFKVYHQAWGRAYEKDRRQSAWFPYRLFLIGGGARVARLREHLARRPWVHLAGDPRPLEITIPPDLAEQDAPLDAASAGSFLVAYGLSFYKADVPEARRPQDVAGFDPRRFDLDELATTRGDALRVPAIGMALDQPCVCGGMNESCAFCDGRGFTRGPGGRA